MKTPKGSGKLSDAQENFLQRMRANRFQVLISNDYDEITFEIGKYASNIVKGTKRGRKRKSAVVV